MAIAAVLALVAGPTLAAEAPADASAEAAAKAAKAARKAAALASHRPKFPIPPKIQRYAERLFQQYDTDGDGVLQAEEWAKMQGDPRLIDINRDGVITADDLAFYIARYSLSHRIHLAMPTQSSAALLAGLAPTANGFPIADAITDGTISLEAAYAVDEEMADDDPGRDGESGVFGSGPRAALAREAAIAMAKKQRTASPWLQRFHVSSRSLPAGLPEWFRPRDLDGDGQITLHEFAPEATRKDIEEFLRYDVDRDGVITPAEAARLGGRSGAAARTQASAANVRSQGAARAQGVPGAAGMNGKKRP